MKRCMICFCGRFCTTGIDHYDLPSPLLDSPEPFGHIRGGHHGAVGDQGVPSHDDQEIGPVQVRKQAPEADARTYSEQQYGVAADLRRWQRSGSYCLKPCIVALQIWHYPGYVHSDYPDIPLLHFVHAGPEHPANLWPLQ